MMDIVCKSLSEVGLWFRLHKKVGWLFVCWQVLQFCVGKSDGQSSKPKMKVDIKKLFSAKLQHSRKLS